MTDGGVGGIETTTKTTSAAAFGSHAFDGDLLSDDFIVVFGSTLGTEEVSDFVNVVVGSPSPLDTARLAHHLSSEEKHVAFAEEFLSTTLVEHDAGVHLRADGEGDTARNVGFDETGDDFDLWTLSSEDKMNTGGATLLSNADDEHFEIFACHHHKVGHLIDDDDNIWHLTFFFGVLLSGFGHFGVVIRDVFNFLFGHEGVAAFHFADCPFHGAEGLLGLGDNRREQVRDVLVLGHFDLLRVNNDELHVGRRVTIKQ